MDLSNFTIGDGFAVVLIGFAMVFAILAIISFVLSIFSFIYNLNEKKKKATADSVSETPIVEPEPVVESQEEDDLELVAVITAAIAASTNTTSDKIVIRSIRRLSNWNKTAINESHQSFH